MLGIGETVTLVVIMTLQQAMGLAWYSCIRPGTLLSARRFRLLLAVALS